MIFLRYEKFRDYLRLYPVNSALIGIVLVFFALLSFAGGSRDPETLLRFGALSAYPPFGGEYWRLLTSMFLHVGFDHLLFNAFAMYVFAPPLERLLGHGRYLAFFLAAGVIGGGTWR